MGRSRQYFDKRSAEEECEKKTIEAANGRARGTSPASRGGRTPAVPWRCSSFEAVLNLRNPPPPPPLVHLAAAVAERSSVLCSAASAQREEQNESEGTKTGMILWKLRYHYYC